MFESKDFREALGRFVTGVTIVTAADRTGAPVGVTVSSYNSVSLDPPLVLWSLAKTSRSLKAFREAKAYVIHVLGRHKQDLALHFAKVCAARGATSDRPPRATALFGPARTRGKSHERKYIDVRQQGG